MSPAPQERKITKRAMRGSPRRKLEEEKSVGWTAKSMATSFPVNKEGLMAGARWERKA